jgi:hypothetical protein
MKSLFFTSPSLAALAASIALFASPCSGADPSPAGKVFELRTYVASPGKFEALHARFRNHTLALFKQHGIEVVGFWTPTDGPDSKDTLMYLVAFPSVEAQKQAWAAFKADPAWKKAKAESESDGIPLAKTVTSKNYTATDYSPLR